MLRPQESALDGRVEEGEQPLVIALDVEHAAGLAVNAELRPGQHLEGLLERAHAAGKRDEAVGARRHRRLALVHRVDHHELAEAVVGDLLGDQRARDDADDLAAALEHRIGDRPHQPDAGAAVHQPAAALDQHRAELARRVDELRAITRARPAKNADCPHRPERSSMAAASRSKSTPSLRAVPTASEVVATPWTNW